MKIDNLNQKNTIFFATRPIAPPWNEGSKNLVYQLAKGISAFSPILLTYKNQNRLIENANVTFQKIYPMDNVPLKNSKIKKIGKQTKTYSSKFYWAFTPKQKAYFLRAFLTTKASIYHFYFSPELFTSYVFRIIKKFKRGKFLQTFATPVQNKSLIKALAFGDAVVVQSDYNLNLLKKNGIKNVYRIYPGIDTDYYNPNAISINLRVKYEIGKDKYVILYCGNYYLGCNEIIINTIRNLTKGNSHFVFIMACRYSGFEDKIAEDNMKKIFKEEQISGKIFFMENVVDMRELMAISDIQIFPPSKLYYKADIPLVLIESLAMEKPIVITDIAPFKEIMKDDVGEVVPPANVDKLTDAILKLYTDNDQRIAKGRRGRKMVIREFNIKNYVAEYEKLYERLL